MKISEFIQGRNVNYDTVRRYINRNPKMFKGHVGRANKIELDDVAVQLLEDKYPAPEPVQVIQDTSARDELLQLHKKYAAAMEKITALTEQNANLLIIQTKQQALEEDLNQKEREIDDLRKDCSAAMEKYNKLKREKDNWVDTFKSQEKEIFHYEESLRKEREENEKLQKQLAAERQKTWWDKLRGR